MDPTQQPHHAAYADYVRSHWPVLVRSAVFLGADAHEAEELAQATLVRCFASWDRVAGADNRDAYVYRMLLNTLRDARRSAWWRLRSSTEVTSVDRPVDDSSEAVVVADAVHRALDGLSRPHRETVVLRYFAQLTEAQTAQVLGVAPGTVKSRLSRALAALAQDRHLLDIGDPS